MDLCFCSYEVVRGWSVAVDRWLAAQSVASISRVIGPPSCRSPTLFFFHCVRFSFFLFLSLPLPKLPNLFLFIQLLQLLSDALQFTPVLLMRVMEESCVLLSQLLELFIQLFMPRVQDEDLEA